MLEMKIRELGVPAKIEAALSRLLLPGENTLSLVKTLWKPSATIPIVWLVVTDRRCVLFSTLRGGQVFKEAAFASINSITLIGDSISILMSDPSADWRLQIDPKYRASLPALVNGVNSKRHHSS
jgi:hypothetical protein